MIVRKATLNDLNKIMKIITIAQAFMIANHNPHQWRNSYPTRQMIKCDIINGDCYVIVDDKQEIHEAFSFIIGVEPSYMRIEEGAWLNDLPYGTIHRLASDGKTHGVFLVAIDFMKQLINNIRCDTHCDNLIMQKLLYENRFKKCGIIYVEHDGSSRLAFQWYENKEDK